MHSNVAFTMTKLLATNLKLKCDSLRKNEGLQFLDWECEYENPQKKEKRQETQKNLITRTLGSALKSY
jgi:hypothetical protein